MKIVFLDVDGVLNHYNKKLAHREHLKYNKKLVGFFDFNYINIRWTKKYLMQCIKHGYKIVISSSWRFCNKCMTALYRILGEDIVKNIIGTTTFDNLPKRIVYNDREYEIINYMQYVNCPSKMIIIDDDVSNKMNKFGYVIKTNSFKGFRRKHYKLWLKFLK